MAKNKENAEQDNQKGYYSIKIKEEFKKLNVTPEEIKELLDVSQPYVSALINGKKQIGKDNAKKLFELFQLDVLILLFGDDPIVEDLINYYKNYNLPEKSNFEPKVSDEMKKKDLQQQLIDSLNDRIRMKDEKIKQLEKDLDKSHEESKDFIND